MPLLAKTLPIISIAALVAILVIASALLTGSMSRPGAYVGMLICTIVWFATAPFWIGREKQ